MFCDKFTQSIKTTLAVLSYEILIKVTKIKQNKDLETYKNLTNKPSLLFSQVLKSTNDTTKNNNQVNR